MRLLKSVFVAILVASGLRAQTVQQLTRITSTTGVTDSMLVAVCDSVRPVCRTRATSLAEFRRALPFANFDSMRVSLIPSAHDSSSRVAVTRYVDLAVSAVVHGLVDSATGAARAQKLTTARTIGGVSFDGTANITVASATGGFAITGSGSFTTTLISTTALATPSALSATQFTAFASTVSGATLIGFGTTGDVTLKNRSGSTALYVEPNSADVSLNGVLNLRQAGNTIITQTVGDLFLDVPTGGKTFYVRMNAGTTLALTSSALTLGTIAVSGITTLAATGQMTLGNGTAAAPSYSFTSSTGTGIYQTGNTLKFAGSGVLQADISSAGINVYNGNAFFPDGTSISPGIGFASDGAQGLYRAGAGTLGLITSSVSSLVVSGGASATITGGAGSFTLQCGTGNSRTCTFRTTNSSGTATTFASGAGDTLKITAHAIAAGLTAASGTPHAACFDATTHEMEDNAALTCTVSARRFKQNIGEVSPAFAWNLLRQVPVDSFTYRSGGRRAFGTIADDLAPIDERLITRDAKGLVNAANYEQLSILTLLVQRDDHRRIDSLITALRKKP